MKRNFSIPKAALIQLILVLLFFFVNVYSFFSEDGFETIITIIRVILLAALFVGIAAFILNGRQIFIDKKLTSLEIVSLVSLSLLTGLSLIGTLSGIIVSFIA